MQETQWLIDFQGDDLTRRLFIAEFGIAAVGSEPFKMDRYVPVGIFPNKGVALMFCCRLIKLNSERLRSDVPTKSRVQMQMQLYMKNQFGVVKWTGESFEPVYTAKRKPKLAAVYEPFPRRQAV